MANIKTKIIPIRYSGTYRLEERTSSENLSDDHKFKRVIAEGFIVFLLWCKFNKRKDISPNLQTPKKIDLFNWYFDGNLGSYKSKIINDLYIAENKKKEFLPLHLKKENILFKQSKNELKNFIGEKFSMYCQLFGEYKDYLNNTILTSEQTDLKGFQSNLEPKHNEILKDWIYPDSLKTFIDIENELLERGYLDDNYKWVKYKISLIDFLITIQHNKFFKNIVKGQKKQDFHYRQFISELYGYGKTGLTETSKKHKPKLEIASIPFLWVENHLNN